MNPLPRLTSSHQRIHAEIFQHPIAHNLKWRRVWTLLERLGKVTREPDGNVRVECNGQTEIFAEPRAQAVLEVDELMRLRHFLLRAERTPAEPKPRAAPWLVVIDQHGARIFRTVMHGAHPRQILPAAPEHHFTHGEPLQKFLRRQPNSSVHHFFEPIAQALTGAEEIMLMGHGKGQASAREQFATWLSRHHPPLHQRIIGTAVVDRHHLTVPQLLAKALEFYPAALPGEK